MMDSNTLLNRMLENATRSCKIAIHKEYKEQIARLTQENKTLRGELNKARKHSNKLEEECCMYEEFMDDVKESYRDKVQEGRSAEESLAELKLMIATRKKDKGVK
jgi:uncharacterized protein YlxW (UPF0749 family)